MADNEPKYHLDFHCEMILEEYDENLSSYEKIKDQAIQIIQEKLDQGGLVVMTVAARIKTRSSLEGKLALKGHKYGTLSDITDIVGCRVITYYNDDVDRVASYIQKTFEVDWENSVDKRKMLKLDTFGYLSLHYICRIPESLYKDPEHPEINQLRFEIQIRSVLQHVWANMYHDTGYKSDIEAPAEYLRMLNRMAGMLELADDEFSRIRNSIASYRHQVQGLVHDGKLDEIPLNGDTFKSYLETKPFEKINKRIASINQAEIHEMPMMPFLSLLKTIGMKTLGDIAKLVKENEDDAYNLAMSQLADTDIDILTSTVGLQNILIVNSLKKGAGKFGLKFVFDEINGESVHNESLAELVYEQAMKLPFMNQQK